MAINLMPPLRPSQVTVLVAQNEKLPWDFTKFGALQAGANMGIGGADYTIKCFDLELRVERKSPEDFLKSIGKERERFRRELQHLRQFIYRAVIVEHPSLDDFLDEMGRVDEKRKFKTTSILPMVFI